MEIKNVLIAGGGMMGKNIAFVFTANPDYRISVYDIYPTDVPGGIRKNCAQLIEKGVLTEAELEERLKRIVEHWPEIRQIIQEELPPRQQVWTLMKSCGMPMTPADLHLTEKDTVDALIGSREIRDKSLTSSLLWDLGLLEETAKKLPCV